MAGDGFSIPDLGSEGSVRLMKNGLAMTSHKFGLDIMALDKGRDFFSQVVAKVHVGFGKDFRLLIGQMTNPCFPAFLDRIVSDTSISNPMPPSSGLNVQYTRSIPSNEVPVMTPIPL